MMDLTLLSTPDLEKLWARTENGAFARKVKEELDQRSAGRGQRADKETMALFETGNRKPETGKGEGTRRQSAAATA